MHTNVKKCFFVFPKVECLSLHLIGVVDKSVRCSHDLRDQNY